MADQTKSGIPSELRLTKAWDVAAEDFAIKTAIAGLAFGAASFVLFRGGSKRVAFTAFGIGCGAGDAFRTANYTFAQEKKS